MKDSSRFLPLILTALLSLGSLSACDTDGTGAENTVLSADTVLTVSDAVTEEAPAERTSPSAADSVSENSDTAPKTDPPAQQTAAESSAEGTAAELPLTESSPITAASSAPEVSAKAEESSSLTEEQAPVQSESVVLQETTDTVSETTAMTYDPDAPFKAKKADLRPYSYDFIDEKKAYIYDALLTAIDQKKTSVKFSTVMNLTSEDYCAVYQQIYNDECSMFYLDTKMQYAVNSVTRAVASANIFYRYSDSEIENMQKVIDAEADRVIAMITPDMSEYDVVKLFYDYLAENVDYDENTENCRDIYGVFADKKAICGGYAKAMEYLCSKVGIDAITITGDADGVPHMWNMVKLGGEWYHIDPTYAVTESRVGQYVRYDYFCVTDDLISRSRTVYEQDYQYPAAVSDTCNYYVKNGLVADSWSDLKKMLTEQVIEASKEKRLVAEVQCGSKELYDDASYRLFDYRQAQAIPIMQNALVKSENKFQCNNISYSQDPNTYVLKLFLEYTE